MKITKKYLQKVIEEETKKLLMESWGAPFKVGKPQMTDGDLFAEGNEPMAAGKVAILNSKGVEEGEILLYWEGYVATDGVKDDSQAPNWNEAVIALLTMMVATERWPGLVDKWGALDKMTRHHYANPNDPKRWLIPPEPAEFVELKNAIVNSEHWKNVEKSDLQEHPKGLKRNTIA